MLNHACVNPIERIFIPPWRWPSSDWIYAQYGSESLIFGGWILFVHPSAIDFFSLFCIFDSCNVQQTLCYFFIWISTVRIDGFVCLFKQDNTALTIMQSSIAYGVICYQLAVKITFYMILVAKMGSIILFFAQCASVPFWANFAVFSGFFQSSGISPFLIFLLSS